MIYLHTKFGDYRFSRSGDMIAGIEIQNGHMILATPLLGVVFSSVS